MISIVFLTGCQLSLMSAIDAVICGSHIQSGLVYSSNMCGDLQTFTSVQYRTSSTPSSPSALAAYISSQMAINLHRSMIYKIVSISGSKYYYEILIRIYQSLCVNDRLLRADYPNDPFHPSSVYKLDERFSFSCYFAMQIFWQDNRYCNFIVQILSSETFKIQKSRWFA